MLIGPASTPRAARGVRPQDRGQPAGLHRAADDQPEPAPDLRRRPARRPPRRPAAVRALRRGDHGHARRADPRRAAARGAWSSTARRGAAPRTPGSSARPLPDRRMLSRVAENLFWMSRYLERAENVARLLDIGLYLELDAGGLPVEDGSAPVEIALNILACRDAFRSAHPDAPTARPSSIPHLRPDQPAVDPEHDRPGPRERPRHAGDARRRRLEPGQSALPLPLQPEGPATVRRQPVGVLHGDQAVVHPLRRPDPEHAAARRGVSLPRSWAATSSGWT